MPHKKGKKKTIPKHKKKGVKIIANHKVCPDNQSTYKKKIKDTKKKGKDTLFLSIPWRRNFNYTPHHTDNPEIYTPSGCNKNRDYAVQNNNKKRRLPIEVMPSGNDDGNVRVIDNLPELKTVNTSTVNTGNTSIGVANLTQAKKIREQVWIHHNGKMFECKCYVTWCTNKVDVFNFQVGHDTPKALGGSNELLNLKPICQNCNQSMGSRYSITEWNQLFTAQRRQMSTMIDRRNSEMATSLLTPIEYEKIDLSSNIFVKQQPSNILADQEVPISPTIQQTEKMQPGNAQLETMPSRNMCYGPLARIMPMRANKSVIIQSAVSVMVLVGAWFFGA